MAKQDILVLLIEDNEADVRAITRLLHHSRTSRFVIEQTGWLSTGLTAIQNKSFDVVLLDLSLPDPGAQGIDTLVRFMASAGGVPVIVMTGFNDMNTAVNCVKYGAQDYLIKDEIQAPSLERAILYAIERRHAETVSKDLMRASLNTMVPNADNASVALVQEHLSKIPSLIRDVRQYLQKNAPAYVEDVEAILRNYDIEVVLREVRDLLQNRGSRRTRTYAEQAQHTVDTKSDSDRPPSEADAKARVLQAIQRLKGVAND